MSSPATEHPDCAGLGIPPHLHQIDRLPDPHFAASELLYFRIRPDPDATYPAPDILDYVKTSTDNSTLRSAYCRSPDDARLDKDGTVYSEFFLCAWRVGLLLSYQVHQQESDKTCSVEVEHTPYPCQYPHTDIRVLCNSEPVRGSVRLSNPLKRRVRAELADLAEVIALPLSSRQ